MNENFNQQETIENSQEYLIIYFDPDNLWRWDYFRLVKEYADGEVEWGLEDHADGFTSFEEARGVATDLYSIE